MSRLAALERRRAAWAAELGRNGIYAVHAPKIIAEIDREIAEMKRAQHLPSISGVRP